MSEPCPFCCTDGRELEADIRQLRGMLEIERRVSAELRAELAATRERAICYRTEHPYCDADLDMHAEAMVAAERERCAELVEMGVGVVPVEEIAAAIRKGEP